MNDLGVFPGGTHSQAFGVSNSGIVVGSADVVAGTTAVPVVWIDGQIAQLSIPADVTSGEAVGVNDSGQIVGRVNYDRCFVWDSPSAEPFEITEVDGVDCGGLLDVNNHGEIIGGGLTADRRSRAFVWKNGRGRVLDAGTDLPNTAAYDINDVGEVAGVAVRHGDDFVEMPVLWSSRGKPLILQSRHTRATSVNDRGEVAVYQAPRHTAEPSALLLFDRRQRLLTQHSVEGVAASPLYHINDRRDAVWTAWVDGLTRSFWCRLR